MDGFLSILDFDDFADATYFFEK